MCPALPGLDDIGRRGLNNDEIAAHMVISPFTAKTHVSGVMIKTSARDRAQLVLAYEPDLVEPRSAGGT